MKIYFSDFFNLDAQIVEEYGAFNISLINDLPLFIDPFLLFGSKKPEYIKLHDEILDYLEFLKEKSKPEVISKGELQSWFYFSEVKQNWLGYSRTGNSGSGLAYKFAKSMSSSMNIVFDDLRKEQITQSNHLEKATLFDTGVGKDNISDFTTNLIKQYLLEFTEAFGRKHLREDQVRKVKIEKVYFDYELEKWMPKAFTLPYFGDYIILTPVDILTKDDNWINSNDLRGNFDIICKSIPNEQMRADIHNFFVRNLPINKKKKKPTQKELSEAILKTIHQFPDIIKFYVKYKEERKNQARSESKDKVEEVLSYFVKNLTQLVSILEKESSFYHKPQSTDSFAETSKRVEFLKDVIENKDGHKLFYFKGKPIKRELDLQIIFRLTWFASDFDVNREPNNGRGPVDYKISKGAYDITLVEFKLASNAKLKQNLENQVGIYEKANDTKKSIKAIIYFDDNELKRVNLILNELKLQANPNIVLIDASPKQSASNVR